MTGHFDTNLNLRALILKHRPKVIVECGAGNGDCTRLLSHMQLFYPFELHSISDKELDIEGVNWHTGLSYKELLNFPDDSIGLCILDTDHNYWTLTEELKALTPKLVEGGLVVMHDVEEFYYDTGMAKSYWTSDPYPEREILACAKLGGLGLALIDFLHHHRGSFKLVRYIQEHYGCAVIEKKTVTDTKVVSPGNAPLFAKPQEVK
jgi:hypothetical protein